LTIGLDDLREGASGFYDLLIPRPSYYTHAVDWYLGALPLLGVPVHWNFTWLPRRKEVAAAIDEKWNPKGSRWIILNPGARWMNKRWPVEYYSELVGLIAEYAPDIRVALLGGKLDVELGAAISRDNPQRCLNLIANTSLPEMIEWIRLSQLMVTNDTGPMHVAAALNKPVVAIFGPTEPRRTGPYHQVGQALRISLPCAPCLKSSCANEKPLECLRAVSPRLVFAEVRKKLEISERAGAAEA
jgi:lipopolysaccharide heptosyltransferase II